MTEKQKSCSQHDDEMIAGFFGPYRFLSNFYVASVWFEGTLYPSTENAYQAAKCLFVEQRESFLNCDANEAKKRSKLITVRSDWSKVKIDVMRSVLVEKFNNHVDLRIKLLETGTKYLEERNYWGDQFWGMCDGIGENNLGKLLMSIRDMFKYYPIAKELNVKSLF